MRISDWSSDVCSSDLNVTNDPTHAGHARLAVRRKIPQMRRTVTMLMHQLDLKIPPLADRAAMVKAARDAAMHDVQHWHVAEQKKWASARQFDPAAGGQLDILEYGPTELHDGKFPYSIRKNHMKENPDIREKSST